MSMEPNPVQVFEGDGRLEPLEQDFIIPIYVDEVVPGEDCMRVELPNPNPQAFANERAHSWMRSKQSQKEFKRLRDILKIRDIKVRGISFIHHRGGEIARLNDIRIISIDLVEGAYIINFKEEV